MNNLKDKKIAIITCLLDDWGGSEELWAKSIPVLKNEGAGEITIYKNKINANYPEYSKLQAQGIKFGELDPQYPPFKKAALAVKDMFGHLYDKMGWAVYQWNKPAEKLYNYLKVSPPDLAIISQTMNFDGLVYAYQCLRLNIPYVIVTHKAIDFYWPQPTDRAYMRETMEKALKCLFVSVHTQTATEEQFGVRLKNAAIVINPVKATVTSLPYPSTAKCYQLACIGRLFVVDKGQDILLKVLARSKWQERNIAVSFIGTGPDMDALKELAGMLGVKNVSFAGHNSDLKEIWANHHALILPSRSEGLPLVIIEAMSLGRIAITTNVGGNAEVIENGVTGFIGEANEKAFDETMELAWGKRNEWEAMGIKAAEYMSKIIPPSPEKIFVETINNSLNKL